MSTDCDFDTVSCTFVKGKTGFLKTEENGEKNVQVAMSWILGYCHFVHGITVPFHLVKLYFAAALNTNLDCRLTLWRAMSN